MVPVTTNQFTHFVETVGSTNSPKVVAEQPETEARYPASSAEALESLLLAVKL
jgi:hypothetical protein